MKLWESLFLTICLFVAMFLTACGSDSGNGIDSDAIAEVKTIHSLGACKGANEGVTKFVTSEDAYYTCSNGVWEIEGASDSKIEKEGVGQIEKDEILSSSSTLNESSSACEDGGYDVTNNVLKDCRDGKVYRTTQIGDQIWMAENLNYVALFDHGSGGSVRRYYPFAIAEEICPPGWHLPSPSEFEILIDMVGGKDVAGRKLKSSTDWCYDGAGSDEYGFEALPEGIFDLTWGIYYGKGTSASFMSSKGNKSLFLNLGDEARIENTNNTSSPIWTMSVRCLKDGGVSSISNKNNTESSSSSESSSSNKDNTGSSSSSVSSSSNINNMGSSSSSVSSSSSKNNTGLSSSNVSSSSSKDNTSSSSSSVSSSSSKNNMGSSSSSVDHCKGVTYNKSTQICDSRDGQVYGIVTIGTGNNAQTWMAENLNYDTTSSYCSNCAKYGRLYTWDVAKKVCPVSWHLPSKAEFETLFGAVGGINVAGKMLKSTSGWKDNGNGSDKYGFSALPAGLYVVVDDEGIIEGEGVVAFFWDSTEYDSNEAWSMLLGGDFDWAFLGNSNKDEGYSVRCIKD